MRKKCLIFALMMACLVSFGTGKAQAFIFINEFLADPASDLTGDANNDGTRDAYDDEFVELFNLSSDAVDISDWKIEDATSQRYSFSADTWIQANSAFVVFGGGSPNLPDVDWQVLTSGNLNLNNGGDTITLRDATGLLIDSYTYGTEAGHDQSITRSPEGSKEGEWVKHTLLANADGKLFSPGYLVNDLPSSSTVPEPTTVLSLSLGLGVMIFRRRK